MKKLTALALAGILTLSACGETTEQSQRAGELILFSTVAAGVACGIAKVC